MSTALNDIVIERERQKQIGTASFDEKNTRNDWVAYVSTYVGRASDAVRNKREFQDFRANMVKAAAVALAAVEAFDAGYACGPETEEMGE